MAKKILVLSTCYPRFKGDMSAIFLETLYRSIVFQQPEAFDIVLLAADHADVDHEYDLRWSAHGFRVKRYRYFIRSLQTLLYGDAVLSNINRHPITAVLLIPLLLLSLFSRAFFELLRDDYVLIHAHWSLPTGLMAVLLGKLFRLPVMVTSHGGDVYGLRGKLSSCLQNWVLSRAEMVNAVSSPLMEEIKSRVPEANVKVKSMGVDEELFKPVADARRRLGVTKNKTLLLFVGRFSEKKGVEYLIEAMEVLKSKTDNLQLLLIGSGNLEEKLRKLTEERKLSSIVSFLGVIENQRLPLYYSAADLLVIPSVADIGGQEGLPVTIMEGLLCGKKIVTTKVGGIAELSEMKSIFFAEQKDGKNLADTIEKALLNDSVSPEKAREEGLRFAAAKIADDFTGFYRELASGNRNGVRVV